jgi:hypothetical protein
MSIIYFSLVSPGEGDVRIDYYDGRYVCEQISKWLMRKFQTSILVMKFPSTESRFLKRKFIPFSQSTSDTFLVMQKYTFNFPVHGECDPHIWTLTTGQWEHHPHLVTLVCSRKATTFPYNVMLKCSSKGRDFDKANTF